MHDVPRFIERKGHDFRKEFVCGTETTYDLFDICVRRLTQLVSSIYPPPPIPLRWRYILESDFSVSKLSCFSIVGFLNYNALKNFFWLRCTSLQMNIQFTVSQYGNSSLVQQQITKCFCYHNAYSNHIN
jgi:hypothetical protein